MNTVNLYQRYLSARRRAERALGQCIVASLESCGTIEPHLLDVRATVAIGAPRAAGTHPDPVALIMLSGASGPQQRAACRAFHAAHPAQA